MRKAFSKIRRIFHETTPKTIERDFEKAKTLIEKIPEDSFQYLEAQAYLSALAKLRLAVEKGWMKKEEPLLLALPRKWR